VSARVLTESQRDLAARYVALAKALARPFKLRWPSHRDDFESAALGALVEAAGTYRADRNVKFGAFARHRIFGALKDVQRSMLPYGYRFDAGHAPTLASLPPEPDGEGAGRVLGADEAPPVGWDLENAELVEKVLRQLPARHARVFRLMYLHGYSQPRAAAAMGLSQTYISAIHRDGLALLAECHALAGVA
jgi:RNA polymerase sigma factor (sigma-70 family)